MSREDRMARAGDYVLGLMDEQERARAERDMALDAEFRDCVLLLSERVSAFGRRPAEELEPDRAWKAVASRIAGMPQMARDATLRERIDPAPPGPDPSRKGLLGFRRPFAGQFEGLRNSLIALCLVAAGGFGFLVGGAMAPVEAPVAVAVLADAQGQPGAFLEMFPHDRLRIVPLREFEVPEGKMLQLWTIVEGETVPLGTLDGRGEIILPDRDLPPAQVGQIYQITLEDAPGAAAGGPEGPVLVRGSAVHPPR